MAHKFIRNLKYQSASSRDLPTIFVCHLKWIHFLYIKKKLWKLSSVRCWNCVFSLCQWFIILLWIFKNFSTTKSTFNYLFNAINNSLLLISFKVNNIPRSDTGILTYFCCTLQEIILNKLQFIFPVLVEYNSNPILAYSYEFGNVRFYV